MIKVENTKVIGLEEAIRGMRNPLNSWDRIDSNFCKIPDERCSVCENRHNESCYDGFVVGNNDLSLMKKLAKAGSVHAKYRRMIAVYGDITAPLYWYKEMDTYKVGTVCNSCSTMHTIHKRDFVIDDFSHEYFDELLDGNYLYPLIDKLNELRDMFIETKDKTYWYQIIQLLPSSYNQRRTYMLNYEVLANIYQFRKNHKLDEWINFCEWIETLPYSELITQKYTEE